MAEKILKSPQLGEGLTKVKIIELYKKEGEYVAKDEVFYSVETDKALVDIESPYAGKITEWKVISEDIIDVGAPVVILEIEEEVQAIEPEQSKEKSRQYPPRTTANLTIPPRTRAYCRNQGLQPDEVALIPGRGGILTTEMVDEYLANKSVQPVSTDQPGDTNALYSSKSFSKKQSWLNARFKRSRENVIPATLVSRLSLRALQAMSKTLVQQGVKGSAVSYVSEFHVFAYLVSRVLIDFPKFRSVIKSESQYREYHNTNLGIAVQTDAGDLVTALVVNADKMEFVGFIDELKKSIDEALKGRDQANEHMQVVLSTLGGGNILFGSPLLVAPAIATLFFSIPDDERKKEDGQAYLSLTFDHQLINGMDASNFLNRIDQSLTQLNPNLQDFDQTHESDKHISSAMSREELNKFLIDKIALLLDISPGNLDQQESLGMLGLDSTKSLILKNHIEENLSIPLSSTLLWSYPTIETLLDYVSSLLNVDGDSNSSEDNEIKPEVDSFKLLESLESLSVSDRQKILSEFITEK